jgi:hypothetical protein
MASQNALATTPIGDKPITLSTTSPKWQMRSFVQIVKKYHPGAAKSQLRNQVVAMR